ncbi:MAG: hypothetical protein ABI461_14550 [Polyangiaceae bacterium]
MDPEFLRVATQPVVLWPLTFFIVWLDERRMSEAMLERAWPPATRGAVVLWFSPFCLLVHFIRTRRSFVGALLGVGAVLLVFVAYYAVTAGVGYAIGVDAFAEN